MLKASLDTNIIIHFYRAKLQHILFDFFKDGLVIYEKIRSVELANHAGTLLCEIDGDINQGKIEIYTDENLKEKKVFTLFNGHVKEMRMLYGAGDLGEVFAISLAKTLGACSLVTDDTKQGGPYMSLLQFEDEVMPFNFADVLILRYLFSNVNAKESVLNFNAINEASNMNWSFESCLKNFLRRFFTNPYRQEDKAWILKLCKEKNVNIKEKLNILRSTIINFK